MLSDSKMVALVVFNRIFILDQPGQINLKVWCKQKTVQFGSHLEFGQTNLSLRYDLIDRPGVLGNYVPVNYHSSKY